MLGRKMPAVVTAFVLLLLAASIVYTSGHVLAQGAPADADGDGLPDAWEIQYNLNPNSAAGQNGGMGDPDRDGLVNGDELLNGTNPRNADTDGDSLSDQWEVENLTDPLRADGDFGATGDPDGDGLLNKDEQARAVDPYNWDSDGDGLPDGWEVVERIKPNDNRGQHGANGIPPGRSETNRARFERFNDDFVPPVPHKHK